MTEYQFPNDPESLGYRIFPEKLESDPHIWFHGTSLENFESIRKEGFKPNATLTSMSYSIHSSLALGYACKHKNGIVIAVRFEDLKAEGVNVEGSILHTYPNPETREIVQPTLVGFCIVPSTYKHV